MNFSIFNVASSVHPLTSQYVGFLPMLPWLSKTSSSISRAGRRPRPARQYLRIDSTDVHADPRDSEASWNYDPTAEADSSDTDQSDESEQDTSDGNSDDQDEQGDGGYYFGYGCLIVTTGPKLPVAAAFTEQKQVNQETVRRVTQDALAVGDPNWMLGDSAFDMLNWHDDLIEEGVVPIAPYNERNTDDPYDIEYRIEQRIKEHSDNVGVWSKQLEETYKQRSQVERTIGA